MVKLSHDAGLTKEVSPLLVSITSFQSLDGHTDLSLAWHFETPTADFSKFACGRRIQDASEMHLRQNNLHGMLIIGQVPI